jgi:hypothetical protein
MESVGFKEWALVCDAIGRGEQSLLIRKGGIHEGREGFSFRHREFFLFPTLFHEQAEKVRGANGNAAPAVVAAGEIELRVFVRVEQVNVVTDWTTAAALQPFHVLREEVVRERFDYDEAPGLHVAVIRAFRVEPVWRIADQPAFGGCRSWLKLPDEPNESKLLPVLSDAAHTARLEEIRRLLPQDQPALLRQPADG